MIKNRYFKTTQGVPFELAIGKNLVDFDTVAALVDGGAANDISAFVVDAATGGPKGVNWGNAVPSTEVKKPLFFAFVDKISATKAIPVSTTPLVANTISAELVAYAAPTAQVSTLSKTSGTIGETQEIEVKIVETTPGNQPLPTWQYGIILTGGLAVALQAIADKINEALEDEFFTADENAAVLTVTSTDASRHFKIIASIIPTKADSTDRGIVLATATTTPAFAGNGTVAQLLELQKEANIRRGIGHYYPNQNATAEEFGLPTDVVTSAGTTEWDIVVLTGLKSEASPTPVSVHQAKHYIFLAVPAGSGADVVAMF